MKNTVPAYYLTKADEVRFWQQVYVGGINQCWYWNSERYSDGSGVFYLEDGRHSARRVAYAIVEGLPDPHTRVYHVCPNRSCVNTNHLIASYRDLTREELVMAYTLWKEEGLLAYGIAHKLGIEKEDSYD